MTSKRLGLLLAVHLLMFPSRGHADQCLRAPAEIPNLKGGPEWEDFDQSGFWRPELHDPRWAGGSPRLLAFKPGAAAPQDDSPFSARVLALGNTVFVAIYVEDDKDGPAETDEVYVGITEGTSFTAHALQIPMACSGSGFSNAKTPPTNAPKDTPAPRLLNDRVAVHWKATDANPSSTSPPTWRRQTAPNALENIAGACWDRPQGGPRWALTLRFDFAGTANEKRRLFLAVKAKLDTDLTTLLGNAAPLTDARLGVGAQTIIPLSPAKWEIYTAYVSSSSPCGTALNVLASNVGVWTGAAGSDSPGSLSDEVCMKASCGHNVFRAKITGSKSTIPSWGVRARFRISDWGSVDRRAARWRQLWNKDPFFHKPGTSDPWIFRHDNASSPVVIDFTCVPTGSDDYCPKLPSGGTEEQQLLVEISRPRGQDVADAYAVKGMRFRKLSEATSTAIISTDGLDQDRPGHTEYEIYLQKVTHNLPQPDAQPKWLEAEAMALAREVTTSAYRIKQQLPQRDPIGTNQASDNQDTNARDPAKQTTAKQLLETKKPRQASQNNEFAALKKLVQQENALAEGDAQRVDTLALDDSELVEGVKVHEVLAMTPSQLFDAIWPTYRIRPYYVDKGVLTNEKGEKEDLLVPMPSFGWYLQHRGALYGFTHDVEAAPADSARDTVSVDVERLPNLPGWRKLTILAKQTAALTLHASALEEPQGVKPCDPSTNATTSSSQTSVTSASNTSGPVGRGCGRCAVHHDRRNVGPLFGVALLALALGYRRRRSAIRDE